ncbi:HAMP domain-containing sensor histidine kinase [Ochrobactrum sp. SFR4]|uniref:sensor histidine kinase n=1 Tax=Ochrobactrum sp. SFR4 TaxID=2717368 RepID=UPI001C8BB1A3|nr:HAMP domain-containing sensor histidine kinase [Ochrobactrum sp. SFR4]MBX8824301.1 HAMP domain-containing histidine kinase [Ochrobactrum sp. SFR4]
MTFMKSKDFQRPADKASAESEKKRAEELQVRSREQTDLTAEGTGATSGSKTSLSAIAANAPLSTGIPPVFTNNGSEFAADDPDDLHIPLRHRLSSKLLLMTILAVLIAEVIILAPSLANMRNQWLNAKHTMIATSSLLLLDANPDTTLELQIQDQLLRSTGAQSITITRNGSSRVLAASPEAVQIDEYIDLTTATPLSDFWGALRTLTSGGNKTMQVSGPPDYSGTAVEFVMSDDALHNRLVKNSRIIAAISLLISLIAAALIYFIIHRLLLRPVGHMYENMFAFGQKPDDPTLIIDGSCRKDELGYAQNRLAQMQTHLQHLFQERKHLADLGLAVSKINHDMRNILASAQLMSDSLADTDDPVVQRFSPKLIRTLNRAITYSETVIAYGRTQEAVPVRQQRLLRPLIHEVEDMLVLPPDVQIAFRNMVPVDFEAYIDKEQMLRVLNNLCRNAVQAMSAYHRQPETEKCLTISAWRIGSTCYIAVADTGPGLPKKARDNLFTAFRGSTRSDGTGLGLVIAQELVRAHGGTIELRDDYKDGALFEIRVPDMPVYPSPFQRSQRNMV